jgi:hypothetical protein
VRKVTGLDLCYRDMALYLFVLLLYVVVYVLLLSLIFNKYR